MIKQIFILFGALFLGYLITYYSGIQLPANVLGMVILFLCLLFKLIGLKDVDKVSDFIVQYLAVFFVVPTVGVMLYFDLLWTQALKILVPLVVSILLGYFVAGRTTEFSILWMQKREEKRNLSKEEY